MKVGLKEKITLCGVIQTYTRRQYPGDIYITDETPKEAYHRVAKTVARRLYKPEMAEKPFLIIFGTVGYALAISSS